MDYNDTMDQLKSSEVIQENALVLSVLIPPDEVRCGSSKDFRTSDAEGYASFSLAYRDCSVGPIHPNLFSTNPNNSCIRITFSPMYV
jgi:hypothetical protein